MLAAAYKNELIDDNLSTTIILIYHSIHRFNFPEYQRNKNIIIKFHNLLTSIKQKLLIILYRTTLYWNAYGYDWKIKICTIEYVLSPFFIICFMSFCLFVSHCYDFSNCSAIRLRLANGKYNKCFLFILYYGFIHVFNPRGVGCHLCFLIR